MAKLNIMETIRNIKRLYPDLSINDIKQMLNIMPRGMDVEDMASWFKSQARNVKKKTKQATSATKKELNKLYSNAKATIKPEDIAGKTAGKTTSGTRKVLTDVYNKARAIAQNPVVRGGGKLISKAAAVGNVVDPIMSGVSTVSNWNKEGSDAITRTLDTMGTAGALGGAAIGAGAGLMFGPAGAAIGGTIGFLLGVAADSRNKNAAAARRELNKINNMTQEELNNYVLTDSGLLKQLSEEQQQDLDFYRETGVPISRAMEADSEPVINQNNRVVGNGVYSPNASVPSPASYSPNPEILDLNLGPVPSTSPTAQSVQSTQDAQTSQGTQTQPVQNNAQGGQTTGGAAAYVPYQSTTDYGLSPEEYALMNKAINQSGQVSQQDIYNNLRQRYVDVNNIIENRNPYYTGDVVIPQRYNADPEYLYWEDKARDAARLYGAAQAGSSNIFAGSPSERELQEQLYRDRIAQQAGVPYADYVKGMTERNNALVKAQAQEVENVLKFQLQQTSDLKEKMAIIQKINEVRVNAAVKIDEQNAQGFREIQKQMLANQGQLASDYLQGTFGLQKQGLANQGTANVASINAAGDIAQERLKLQDPYNIMDKIGRFTGNVSYASPSVVQGTYQSLPSNVQQSLFGKELKADEINTLYGLNTQQNMQQAQESNLDKFIRKIKGVQANEQ